MIASLRLPRGLLLAGFALLVGCASKPPTPPEPQGPPPVGAVTLQSAQNPPPEAQALDVGVLVFTNQASEDEVARAGAAIFAEIRETETQTLPAVLRNTLLQSNQWGIVRVLPEADPSMDLIVSGTIPH